MSKPTNHKHDWNKISDIKKNIHIKVYSCTGCDAVKIETVEIIDKSALEQLGIRDTKMIPPGEYEDDRLIFWAFQSSYDSRFKKTPVISIALSEITDKFKELLSRADKPIPKNAMQIVADRMDKLGYGYKDTVYFDVPYVVQFDINGSDSYEESFGNTDTIKQFLESMQYLEIRMMLREFLSKFDIRSSIFKDDLTNNYDAKGRNINILHEAIAQLIRIEIKNANQERVPLLSIIDAMNKQLGFSPDECFGIIKDAAEREKIIIFLENDLITTDDASKLLTGDIKTNGTVNILKILDE